MPTCLALTVSLPCACTKLPPVPFCGVNSDLTPKIHITDFVKIHINIITMKPPRNPYLKLTPTNINSTAQPSGANVDNSVPSLEPPAGISVDVTSTASLKRSSLFDVSVAGYDAPMPFTFHPPTSLSSSRASRSACFSSSPQLIHLQRLHPHRNAPPAAAANAPTMTEPV